jgi:hypothetical protein
VLWEKLAQVVRKALPEKWGFLERWEFLVVSVLLALPVFLVLLAAMDPSVRQVLREWLLRFLPNPSPAKG